MERELPTLNLIRNAENVGFAAACNQALRDNPAEFVLLLNPDVSVDGQTIQRAVEYLRGNPDVGIVGAKMVLPGGAVDGAAHRTFKRRRRICTR